MNIQHQTSIYDLYTRTTHINGKTIPLMMQLSSMPT